MEQVQSFFEQEQERPGRWGCSHRPGQELLRPDPAGRIAELRAIHGLQGPEALVK